MKPKHKIPKPWKRLEMAIRSRGLIGKEMSQKRGYSKKTPDILKNPDLMALLDQDTSLEDLP